MSSSYASCIFLKLSPVKFFVSVRVNYANNRDKHNYFQNGYGAIIFNILVVLFILSRKRNEQHCIKKLEEFKKT